MDHPPKHQRIRGRKGTGLANIGADPFYRSPLWLRLRALALKRDGYMCTVPGCGAKATHVDHIQRRKAGGADALFNLRSLCRLHDGQVKELPNGKRRNDGKFRLLGCDADGWPRSRNE